MFINKIELYNWKNYKGNHSFSFNKINLIKGKNGLGKSNLIYKAPLFNLFAETFDNKLLEISTFNTNECYVKMNIQIKNDIYEITRNIPSNLSIVENNKLIEIKSNLNSDKQKYLENIIGTRQDFLQFRIIDAYNIEGNILEKSDKFIKKIIFSNTEEKINNTRLELLNLKNNYENKNIKNNINNHYPSEKRLEILYDNIQNIIENSDLLERNNKNIYIVINEYNLKIGEYKERQKQLNNYIKKIKDYNECPTCNQEITNKLKDNLIDNKQKELDKINEKLIWLENQYSKENKNLLINRDKINILNNKKYKLKELILKLELSLKNEKYTDYSDKILLIKESIKKFDEISSLYIKTKLEELEPIINYILDCIKFKIKFNIGLKGELEIFIINDKNIKIKYNQLSTGQRFLLQIAFKLALLLNNGKNGIIIIDEGASALDNENLLYMLKIFDELPFQLFMVLHKDIPENNIDINIINLDNYERNQKNY